MKYKEEPSSDLSRGNPARPVRQYFPADPRPATSDSTSRPGDAAAAPLEKPALGLFPESLMEAVVDPDNIEQAWKNVKANRGAPGPDGITLAEFPGWYRARWPEIRQQLLDGTYRPSAVRRVTIDKPDGGSRDLGIPNVIERLIQQAIVQVLTPVFDPTFSESSHGFRPRRSAHGAAKQVRRTIRRGYRFAVDLDLSKFFDRVQHDILMSRILLDDLDKELERRGLQFVRYADDMVIFTKSRRSAERVFASIGRYLTQKLRLVVNQEKSRIVESDGVEFLGFVFRGKRATINVSAKSVHRFKRRIRELTGRSRGISMARRMSELRSTIRGWTGYFALASQLKRFDRFDQWIRRRIRACYWKRWRHVRTRRRELIRLGVPRRQAIRHAKSRKGPWRMSKTIASGVGMTNEWLRQQGLVSLKSLWAELAPLRRTA